MMPVRRSSVYSKLHESRMAFCCISRPEVATPPRVGSLAGSEQHTRLLESVDSLGGGGHVGAFRHRCDTVTDQRGGLLAVQLILGGAGSATSTATSQMEPAEPSSAPSRRDA